MDAETLQQISRNNSLVIDARRRALAEEKRDKYKSEYEEWRKQLDAAQILVNVLKAKTDAAEMTMGLWSTMLAPIRCIPMEILTEIFVLACDGDVLHLFPPEGVEAVRPTSHVLTHVCKYWRDVALRSPKVWSHWIVLHPASFDEGALQWDDLERFYGRNLARLEIKVPNNWSKSTQALFNAALKNHSRLVALKLSAPCNVNLGEAAKHLDMPLLEELSVDFGEKIQEGEQEEQYHIAFQSAPKLKKLFIRHQIPWPRDLLVPWSQITHLFLGRRGRRSTDTCHGLLLLLKQLSNLTHLYLSNVRVEEGRIESSTEQLRSEAVVLPRLRVLEIHDGALEFLKKRWYASRDLNGLDFLARLTTPSLESFDLLFGDTRKALSNTYEAFSHTTAFLKRAPPTLRRVRLAACLLDWLELVKEDRRESPLGLLFGYRGSARPKPRKPRVMELSGSSAYFHELARSAEKEADFDKDGKYHSPSFKPLEADVFARDQFIDCYLAKRDGSDRDQSAVDDEEPEEDAANGGTSDMWYNFEDGAGPFNPTLRFKRATCRLLGEEYGAVDGERTAFFAF
ncbi:hypothetical protein D9611_005056 [Ephemerocybe angulata]|uniref:F-box domain-containing protein n=1 Tax=Ephemerocybe angulata TaxID=980116 RepID=A0A8H5B2S0_9AGAR|nr:hypothetical protein D9611_005056 [Tulosesus angulatus]